MSDPKEATLKHAEQILKDGVSPSEEAEAIEIVLRSELDLYDKVPVFNPYVHNLLWAAVIIGIGLMLCGVCCPRSTIGIGKAKRRMELYLLIIRQLKWVVGVWLVAVIASFTGSAVYEWLSK